MAALLDRYRGQIALLLLALLLGGLGVWWQRQPVKSELVIATPGPSPARERVLTVDVAGAVVHPGLYKLPEGARIADAILAAGGETDDADLARMNRAAKLKDEQQVRVPRLAGPAIASPAPSSGANLPVQEPSGIGALDINSATEAQLDTLPGIGPVTAQQILAYRRDHGPFTSVEQLKEAKLVNNSTFDKIKGLIVVR